MLRWDGPPAAEAPNRVAVLEARDNFAHLRNKLREIAADREEWAGIPIPISDERLVIEPSYKFAALGNIGKEDDAPGEPGLRIRNEFWSHRWRCRVAVYERQGKAYCHGITGTGNAATMLLHTIGASFAWGIEQESNAVRLLGSLVTHVAFKQYMLTGMFMETSKRSRVTYIFRRLRPTIAIKERKGAMCILAAMCMHPIGYYAGSWAGCMCPTDDVIAHLMLMRGDEPMFWRRCNQHHPHHPEAGL